MSLVIAKDVSKIYQAGEIEVKAIEGVSFEIGPASFVSFVGPSGSGKTTLLNLIGCLDSPTSGNLSVVGTDVASLGRADGATLAQWEHFYNFDLMERLPGRRLTRR